MPVAALLLSALPDRTNTDDREAMRLGPLGPVPASRVLVLIAAGAFWLWRGP